MPSPVQFNVSIGTLPPNFTGSPQDFANAIASLLLVTPVEDWNSFLVGSSTPTANLGPWLKDGQEWWVWSDSDAAYVPLSLDDLSLRRYIGETAPNAADYDVWIQTDSGGVPQAIKIYVNAPTNDWVDVYAANYYTKSQLNTAYAKFSSYTGSNQFITAGSVYQKVSFDATSFVVGSTFDNVNNRFTAPIDGYYNIRASLRFDNTASSTPTGQSINIAIRVNGVTVREAEFTIGDSTLGTTLPVFGILNLAQNDYVEIWAQVGIATGTATWQITSDPRKTVFEGNRIV